MTENTLADTGEISAIDKADKAQNEAMRDIVNDLDPYHSEKPAMPADPFALSQNWSRGNDFKKPFIYALNHGKIEESEMPNFAGKTQIVKIRRLDMGDLLKLGIAEELDFMTKSLMAIEDTDNKEEKPDTAKDAVASVILKGDNFERMEKMVNTVCLAGILLPKLYAVPMIVKTDKATGKTITEVNENARQNGLVYIDSIPFGDRMELFSVIFESEGLSTFREEQEASVGNVANVTDVSLPAD